MLDLKNPISKTTDRVKKRGNVHKASLASARTTNKDYQKKIKTEFPTILNPDKKINYSGNLYLKTEVGHQLRISCYGYCNKGIDELSERPTKDICRTSKSKRFLIPFNLPTQPTEKVSPHPQKTRQISLTKD